jgi:hypothetical protein
MLIIDLGEAVIPPHYSIGLRYMAVVIMSRTMAKRFWN